MATKKATTKKTATKKTAAHGKTHANGSRREVKVRMYRQGLGDCFLITLTRSNGKPYYIMIDCGVILGTQNAAATMQKVVQSIKETTDGHIDLLIATHEHWDHLSGFLQAQELFSQLKFDQVWLAWTEDPADPLARELREEHQNLRMALAAACAHMRAAGSDDQVVDGLLGFFGAAGQGTTGDALRVVKGFCPPGRLRYCRPSDPPVDVPDCDARLYVLGPPHDRTLIKRFNPSKSNPETYGLAAMYMDQLAPVLTDADVDAPFDANLQIPLAVTHQLPFFQTRYWGENPDGGGERDQSWRRIDADWLDSSAGLALQLDSATNNTSLALAIELGDGEVLLFVADAQVGNWLSWQDLKWSVNGDSVTGPELLQRTVFYKTGHHGSHNATLKEKGLEQMGRLRLAMIPVDHDMAVKKRWGKMPLDEIEKTLNKMTGGRVLRIDRPVPTALAGQVEGAPLYYEVPV